MPTITDLPDEILLHIFRCYLEIEDQRNLMKNIGQVCFHWKDICLDRALWRKFDGTVSLEEMVELSKLGCLKNTKILIMSSSYNSNNLDECTLFSCLKNVEVINFSKVKKLSKNTLSIIASNCFKLREIKIEAFSKKSVNLNYEMVGAFFTARGCGLVKIILSYCSIQEFELIIRCIVDCCPNLEHLDLTNISRTGVFPTDYVQIHCPKLKVLHLDHNIRIKEHIHSLGFPALEVFTYLDLMCCTNLDNMLNCLLLNSPNLKFLSLINCHISAETLCALPACDLECLYASRSSFCYNKGLIDVLKKWHHSLKEVDISYASHYVVNAISHLIAKDVQSRLECINLNFTKITVSVIDEILQNCTQLKVLSLQGCQNLERGMKKIYSGKSELEGLEEKIKYFKRTHPDEIETIEILW